MRREAKNAAAQLPQVARQGSQTNAMHSGSRDGSKRNAASLNELGFHSAFSTYPEDFGIILNGLQDGECGIHSAAGPAGADQQTHCKTSVLRLSRTFLCPDWREMLNRIPMAASD